MLDVLSALLVVICSFFVCLFGCNNETVESSADAPVEIVCEISDFGDGEPILFDNGVVGCTTPFEVDSDR